MADAFARIYVDYLVEGNARVTWELNRHFIDPGPYAFQLQFARAGVDVDDWLDVGAPVVDTYYTFDLEKRLFGKEIDAHYRVVLTTSVGTYYSPIEAADGKLAKRDWLFVREFLRKEQLRHRVQTSPVGYLLKARRYGPKCEECTDRFTEEVTNSNCPACYGTGFENGYYAPVPNIYCELGLQTNRTHRDGQSGTAKQDVQEARFLGNPQLYSYDVWVSKYNDERYYLHNIKLVAQQRGVTVVFSAELRLAPFTDIIYTLPITSQQNFMGRPQNRNKVLPICPQKITTEMGFLHQKLTEAKTKQKKD